MIQHALIVAHGQPSDPEPAARALAALADRVAQLLPGWQVSAATLAEPGAIARAVAGQPAGLVFPMFMAGGWFTRVQIPAKLAEAGATGWTVLEPFGCDPRLHALCATLVREAGAEAEVRAVILAAHGSFKSEAPANVARRAAAGIAATGVKSGVKVATGFIDQHPQLAGLTGFGPNSVCLPFFAAEGGHVTEDIPHALASAGFQGRILPPVGLDHRVPGLIAAALRRGDAVCATACAMGRAIDAQ